MSDTHHQATPNDGVWSSECDFRVFDLNVRFAFLVCYDVAQIANMSAAKSNINAKLQLLLLENVNYYYHHKFNVLVHKT